MVGAGNMPGDICKIEDTRMVDYSVYRTRRPRRPVLDLGGSLV